MGWIANVLFMVGVYAIGNKHRVGFVMNTIANGLYAVIGVRENLWDLVAISLIMCGLNVWNWKKWENEV